MQQAPMYINKKPIISHHVQDKSRLRSTLTYPTTDQQTESFPLNSYSSAKHFRSFREDDELLQLQQENEILKNQIKQLTTNLKNFEQQRQKQIHQYELEIQRLKKLIQKSYYSIKTSDSEKQAIRSKLTQVTKQYEKEIKKNTSLQEKLKNIEGSWKYSKKVHEHEIKLVWERVSHLQRNLENVVRVMEEEKEQSKKWKILHTAPKFYNR